MTQDNEDTQKHNGDFLAPDEAAEYLGVPKGEFIKVLQRFGVGRYYQPTEGRHFVYAKEDLDRIKSSMAETTSG